MNLPRSSLVPAAQSLMLKEGEHFGNYVLGPVLSSGLFGCLHDAYDSVLDRHVTLRAMIPHPLLSSALEQARALARFRHPSLIQTYHCIEEGGRSGLLGEALQGVRFEQAWRSESDTNAERVHSALSILGSALDALSVIHRAGWLHLNICASNYLLSMDGRTVLLDCGLVAQASQVDCVPKLRELGIYDAPEVRSGDSAIDHRADIFSVAVLFAWWLLDRDYFSKCARGGQINAEHIADGLRIAEYPPVLSEWLVAALDSSARKRPTHVDELRNNLLALSRQAQPTSIPARAYRVCVLDKDPDFARVIGFYMGQLMEGAQISIENQVQGLAEKIPLDETTVLILDVEMPGAAELLRMYAAPDHSALPYLVLSSVDPAREMKRFEGVPADKVRVLARGRDIKRTLRELLGTLLGEHVLRHA